MNNTFEISSLIQDNNKDEAEAISNYTKLLDAVSKSTLEEYEIEKIFDIIREIIADELNHQKRLQEIYTLLTSIEPNKE